MVTGLICHRGDHRSARENTMDAFEQAVLIGAAGIETDVRITADGMLVLYHDRLLSESRPVESVTRVELEQAVGYAVPTLVEAIDAWPDLWWLVELKAMAALQPTLELLKRRQDSQRLTLISFWHDALAHACRVGGISVGVSLWHRPVRLSAVTAAGLARFGPAGSGTLTSLVWNFEFMDPRLIAEAQQDGWSCFAYHVETADDHDRCRQLGLCGVITDFPQYMNAHS